MSETNPDSQLSNLDENTNYNSFVIKNDWPIIGTNISEGDKSYYAKYDAASGNTYFYTTEDSTTPITGSDGQPITQPVNIICKRLYIADQATVEGCEIIALNRNPVVYVQSGGTLTGNNIYNSTVTVSDGGISEKNYNVSTVYNINSGGISKNDTFVEPGFTKRTPFDNPNNTRGLTVLAGDGICSITIATGGTLEGGSFAQLDPTANPSAKKIDVVLKQGSQFNLPADYNSTQFNAVNIANENPILWGGKWTAKLVDGKTVYTNGTTTYDGPVNLMNGATLTVENGAVVDGLVSINNGRINTITVQSGGILQNSDIYTSNVTINSGGTSKNNTYVSSSVTLKTTGISDTDGYYMLGVMKDTTSKFANSNLTQYITNSDGSLSFNSSNRNGGSLSFSSSSNLINPSIDEKVGSVKAYPSGGENDFPCFLAGSLIETVYGYIAVEDLKVGDQVYVWTSEGKKMQVITSVVGSSHFVRPSPFEDVSGYPVCITKDAIAPNVPFKDLFVTPEHCLFFEGKFTPVRMLVNGYSIYYDRSQKHYFYYHVETGEHSVICANGILTESFLNTANHALDNENVVKFPKTWSKDAAAPLAVDRGVVEPIFKMILNRARENNIARRDVERNITGDHDVHLITDNGQVITRMIDNERITFIIPKNTRSVRIISRSSRPSDAIGPFVDDRRSLGVLIRNITLFSNSVLEDFKAHLITPKLAGWHDIEDSELRWTNGDAVLPLGDRCKNSSFVLVIEIVSAGPYLLEDHRTLLKQVI